MKSWPKIDGALADYVDGNWLRDSPLKRRLREETAKMPGAGMQISAHQGQQIGLLTRAVGARRAVEVGTFTGYSSIAIARGLEPGGRLVCFDVSEEYTAVARRHWAQAGLDDRIELRLGPALDGLRALPDGAGIDLAFVDADKGNYPNYLHELVPRVRTGGLIIADNVLWHGGVVDESAQGGDVAAIRRFNDEAIAHPLLDTVLLSVGDGLLVMQKKPQS
jgi:predicted O-methyltransferase YrrM